MAIIFGYEAKQILYGVGFLVVAVVAIVSIYFLFMVKLKLKNIQQEDSGFSEEEKLKAQITDLESQRKEIADEIAQQSAHAGGLKGKKKADSIAHDARGRVVSVKHQAAKKAPKVEIIEETDTEITPFDAVRTKKSKFSIKYWKAHFLERLHPETTALINMELLNGFHRLFIVKEEEEGFRYRNKKYLFDNEAKYYIIDSKLWCYDYHENFVLPVKRKIPLTAIKKSLEHSNISEVEYATNPSTLERFTISKIAEGIMKGQAIDEFMKQIRLILIIAMVTSVIHLALFMFKSGMLQSIKIPGVTS